MATLFLTKLGETDLAWIANSTRLSKQEMRDLISMAGDLRKAIRQANVAPVKGALYRRLGIRLVYHAETNSVHAKADLASDAVGIGSVSGGGFEPSAVAPVLEAGVNVYGPHWTPSQHACAGHAYMSCNVGDPGR